MSSILEFVRQEFIWVAVAATSGSMLFADLLKHRGSGQSLTPAQLTHMINREDAVVVDIRNESDFDSGHIVGARHIPAGEIATRLTQLEKYRNQPIILVCQTGSSIGASTKALRQAGFEKVFYLNGGHNAWLQASMPTERKAGKSGKKNG